MDALTRFMANVDRSDGETACHPWVGGHFQDGYGRFWLNGKAYLAHRWLLGHHRGQPLSWSDDLREMACHTCDYPPCCNPAHLYAGTARSNVADAIDRKRHQTVREAAKSHCVHGHEFTPDNIYWHKNGSRQCRECRKLRQRKPGVVSQSQRTHCPRGHEYSAANTLIKNGSRNCRTCHRDRERSRRALLRR